jgi:hypothetical protein
LCDHHHGMPPGVRVVQVHGSASWPGAREKSFKPAVVIGDGNSAARRKN